METWVIYTAIYAVLIGFFECAKKKAIEKNYIYEVLTAFTAIAFILATFTCKDVFNINIYVVLAIFVKSLAIVIAWIISLYVMRKMSFSLYSVINLSRIIFVTIMSAAFLGEIITLKTLIGMLVVILGLFLVNKVTNSNENKETSFKNVFLLLCACVLNAVAGILDKKVLMHATGDQMQFWFLLFLVIMYSIVLIVKRRKIHFAKLKKNYWILIAAVSLVIGDKFLFAANEMLESKVTIMTLIKQISAIESIILGKVLFKEKGIIKKLLCSILIISGIAIVVW